MASSGDKPISGNTEEEAANSQATQATGVEQAEVGQSASTMYELPAGCLCSIKRREAQGGARAYTWNYNSQCPVQMEQHTSVFLPMFRLIWDNGHGFGGYSSGGMIKIDGGEISLVLDVKVCH